MAAGNEKLKLGIERLDKAGDDQDLLGAALTSLHGALEDRFRELLVTTPEVPEADHARILDVTRVQWAELLDLMRLHRNLSAEDALLVRRMNRERQAVAHGGRFRGKRVVVERYAHFARSFFPTDSAADGLTSPPGPTALRQRTLAEAARQPDAPARAMRKPTAPKAAPIARPVAANPGVTLTAALLLIIGCAALGMLVQTETRRDSIAPTAAPIAPPLPTVAAPEERLTTEPLNLRDQPGLEGAILLTLPAETRLTLLGQGPVRDGRQWVQVRAGEREGWVDAAYLREP